MKIRNAFISVLLAAALLTTGCGSSSYKATEAMNSSWKESVTEDAVSEIEENGAASGASLAENVQTGRKLIRTFDMTIQTKEFDAVLEGINTRIAELGGYIENSSLDSGSVYYNRYNRYADLKARIPSDQLDKFVENVKESANVTYISEYTDDITLKYVDTESRKLSLETERDRLMELLEKAETVEEIITIESRLSEVRYELESYASQLRTYDNQVDYSTVNLSIHEVEREVKAEEKSFWDEVKDEFTGSLYEISQGLRGFAIWFLGSLPYLLGIALLACAAVLAARGLRRRRKTKKADAAKKTENTNE